MSLFLALRQYGSPQKQTSFLNGYIKTQEAHEMDMIRLLLDIYRSGIQKVPVLIFCTVQIWNQKLGNSTPWTLHQLLAMVMSYPNTLSPHFFYENSMNRNHYQKCQVKNLDNCQRELYSLKQRTLHEFKNIRKITTFSVTPRM